MATLCEDLLAAVLRLAPSTQADDDVLTGDEVAAAAAAGSVLAELKSVLHGDETTASSVDPAQCDALGAAVVSSDVFDAVALRLAKLPFEARKDAAQIITTLVKRNLGGFAAHVAGHARMLPTFMSGFEDQRVALHCGAVLREGVRHEPIAAALLGADDLIWKFFSVYVHLPNFDIASDAFGVLRDALTRHKQLAAQFLEDKYDRVFEVYDTLLTSDNYVTRRQSLKLLGELLLDRSNFNTMMRYISSRHNLKTMMILLRDKSSNIRYEAFHVFKVFVANPRKPDDVVKILATNQVKLVAYLKQFETERADEQFCEEKALIIKTLEELHVPEGVAPPSPSPSPPPPGYDAAEQRAAAAAATAAEPQAAPGAAAAAAEGAGGAGGAEASAAGGYSGHQTDQARSEQSGG